MRSATLMTMTVAVALATMVVATAGAATPVRPGMSIHIELPGEMNPDPLAPKDQPFQNSCTLSFLFQATVPVPETSQKPTTTPKKKTEPKKKAKKSKKARKGKARKGKKARRANGDGRRVVQYATTAGHCTLTANDATEQTHAPGTGPVISLSQRSAGGAIVPGPRIGRVVYTGNPFPPLYPNPDLPEYMDIGIIELDPGVVTNPAVCHFGGPTALRQGPVEAPEMLHLYGTGGQTGLNRETGTTLLPGRSGLGSSALHPNVVSGSYPTSGGDSGSPITDAAGRAVALVTSNAHQPRIEVSLARAEKVLGLDLELRTAPLATGAAPFGIASECVPPKAQA